MLAKRTKDTHKLGNNDKVLFLCAQSLFIRDFSRATKIERVLDHKDATKDK